LPRDFFYLSSLIQTEKVWIFSFNLPPPPLSKIMGEVREGGL